MRRAPTVALAALMATAGCKDMGLPGNIPLDAAEQMPPTELVAAVHVRPESPADEIVVDGRLWVPWGRPVAFGPGDVRPVGSAHGLTVHARAWDRSPYDMLFLDDSPYDWQGYAPVIGR